MALKIWNKSIHRIPVDTKNCILSASLPKVWKKEKKILGTFIFNQLNAGFNFKSKNLFKILIVQKVLGYMETLDSDKISANKAASVFFHQQDPDYITAKDIFYLINLDEILPLDVFR